MKILIVSFLIFISGCTTFIPEKIKEVYREEGKKKAEVTISLLEEKAYKAGVKDGENFAYGKGYLNGYRKGCKDTKEKILSFLQTLGEEKK